MHPEEKYSLYCENCRKNLCNKCVDGCIDHKDKIRVILLDKKTFNSYKYIIEKIESKNQSYLAEDNNIDFEDEDDDSISSYELIKKRDYSNIQQNDSNIIHNENKIQNKNDNKVIQKINIKKRKIGEESKGEIINIINENNNEKLFDDEYYNINLLTIILDDYKNYPNFNHIETISNVEIFVMFDSGDYNEINLNYVFLIKKILKIIWLKYLEKYL